MSLSDSTTAWLVGWLTTPHNRLDDPIRFSDVSLDFVDLDSSSKSADRKLLEVQRVLLIAMESCLPNTRGCHFN